jgi:hypothetical protein
MLVVYFYFTSPSRAFTAFLFFNPRGRTTRWGMFLPKFQFKEKRMTTIANTAAISLADFVKDFGNSLRDAVDQQNPPIFHPEDAKPSRDAVMDGLLRKPFAAQREAVHADRKSTRLNSSHRLTSRMPSSA